jgi:hypothetical protein
VLIGDASAHLDGPKNSQNEQIEKILSYAQPPGQHLFKQKMALFTIRVTGEDPDDYEKCEKQFRELAAGREYPGKYWSFDPKGAPAFITEMVQLILKAEDDYIQLLRSGGKSDPGGNERRLGLIVDYVKAGLETRGDAPTFTSGYVARLDRNGASQLEPFVLVQKEQLALFNATLTFIVTAMKGQGGKRDIGQSLKSLQMISTQLDMGEPIDAKMSPAKIMQLGLGFPVRNKIFEITLDKIAQMPDPDFHSWVKAMEASVNVVKSHLDNKDIWIALGNDPTPRSAFVKVNDLP